MLSFCITLVTYGQGMTDSQVIQFVKTRHKAGASQSQIVTGLLQRGVKMDQIRRIRDQYQDQITDEGKVRASLEDRDNVRLNENNDGTTYQELTTAKMNTTGEIYTNANDEHDDAELDVQSESEVAGDVNGKRIFGHDVFRSRTLTFEPNQNVPTPQNYVLGPGDVLVVDIYGVSQRSLSLTIAPDGTVRVPDVGPVTIGGLTLASAQSRLRQTLGSRYQNADLRLTVSQHRTIMVNVMGAVRTPGTYHLSAFSTVFHALYRAGGISQLGTLRNVKVIRGGRVISKVDIYDFILTGELTGNVRLQDDDVIQVSPYENVVGISGNVKRPMFYEMKEGESVATLLGYAGGFTGDAYRNTVRIDRKNGERHTVYNVNEFDYATFNLKDGDVVEVSGMINRYENMVEVKGAVFRPGQFELGGSVNSVKSLIEAASGVTEDAFTSHAVLHRLKADRSLEVLPVDVRGILDGVTADIPLQNEDVLFIPTQEELRQERTLTITGAVLSPGSYQYADNMTIEDLIVQAGGLLDQASLARVDVSRRIVDPYATEKTDEIAKTFSFDLHDGLLIDSDRKFLLEPYDVIHVRRSPVFHTARNIQVTGEVNFEGAFTLPEKDLRLSDAIKMAGGISKRAYLRGARLTRTMNEEERLRMREVRKAIREKLEAKDSIVWDKMDMDDHYVVGIELDKALKNPGSDEDIIIREGDQIFIPEYNGSVRISGDVNFPNTVTYKDGKNWKYYVKEAGGLGENAKKKKGFIVYQNGQVAEMRKSSKIEPGCEIVVPSKKSKHFWSFGEVVGMGTTLTALAAMITSIVHITK